ncbi:SIMPL domain-containing protein [Agromyces atrinae]|uniref:DUF541 domain-containing protein n=1 Tax=Agromyces atrinae TaxID=592376 RepID=A0A4Q2M8Q3_9MICO|nr:SIMPL domain-containing protein [Agromyces atrinae]NYD65662.1 hypothetical protein [Agromyces atrinae]RXZ85460.1 DUF541 domain-containing protein [Agromyces atrinae]
MTTITVAGEAESIHTAEVATAHLTVSIDGPDRDVVLSRAGGVHSVVLAGLEVLQSAATPAVASHSSDRVHVTAQRPWNADGAQLDLVYTASAGIRAEFTDIDALSSWLGQVATLDGVEIPSIEWSLTRDTRESARAAAQRDAVAAAIRSAEVYAESLGLATVTAVAIGDAGLLGIEPGPAGQPKLVAAMRNADMSAGGFALRPGDITVSASVHARFEAS